MSGKKYYLMITGLFLAVIFTSCNDNSSATLLGNWKKQSDFNGYARYGASSFVIGNRAYMVGGYNSEIDKYLYDVRAFDTTQHAWFRVDSFPGPGRFNGVAFTINGKGYYGTGYDKKNRMSDFYEYDPATDVWTPKADFPGGGRYGAVGFSIGDKGYIGFGYNGDDIIDLWSYDPNTNEWSEVDGVQGVKRRDAVAFVIDGKAYIATGTSNGSYETSFYRYDPSADVKWEKLDGLTSNSSYSILRSNAVAFVANGKGYVGGGYNLGNRSDFWEYDPITDTWKSVTSFEGVPRKDAIGFSVGNLGFMGTGTNGSYNFSDLWSFSPDETYNEND